MPPTYRFMGFNSFVEYSGKLYAALADRFGFLATPQNFQDNVLIYDLTTGWDLQHRFDPTINYKKVSAITLQVLGGNLYTILYYTPYGVSTFAVEMWVYNGVSWSFSQTLNLTIRLNGSSITYGGNIYYSTKRVGVIDDNQYIDTSNGTNWVNSYTIPKDHFLNAFPLFATYGGNLYYSYSSSIYVFNGVSWSLSNTFVGVDTENDINGIYGLTEYNGFLYALMTTGFTFDSGGPEGFAVLMTREVWKFNGATWSMDSTIPITSFTNDPSYNTDPCSDIHAAQLVKVDPSRLVAILYSQYNSHIDVFEYNLLLQTWSETSTDTTFGSPADSVSPSGYYYNDIGDSLVYSANGLLYLVLLLFTSSPYCDVWTFPTSDA